MHHKTVGQKLLKAIQLQRRAHKHSAWLEQASQAATEISIVKPTHNLLLEKDDGLQQTRTRAQNGMWKVTGKAAAVKKVVQGQQSRV
jgi:hypothetical protein